MLSNECQSFLIYIVLKNKWLKIVHSKEDMAKVFHEFEEINIVWLAYHQAEVVNVI